MRRKNSFDVEPREIVVPEFHEEMSVLDCFDAIAEQAEDCELSPEFMHLFQPFLERAAAGLQVNQQQVVLLCAFLTGNNSSVGIHDLQRYFSCSSIRIIRLWDAVEQLCDMGYLELCEGRRGSTKEEYILSEDGLTALKNGTPIHRQATADLSSSQYVNQLRRIISGKRHSRQDDAEFIRRINEFNAQNTHLTIARELCNADLSDTDKAMLTFILIRTLLTNGDNIDAEDIVRTFDDDPFGLQQQLVRGEHELLLRNYIQNASSDGIAKKDVFELTDSTRKVYLSEFTITAAGNDTVTGLILPEHITSKQLFFSPEDNRQITSLSDLLQEDKIVAIRERLERAGMRRGFCCLFYGAPGTGKTETAMQLARQTGRAIMQVDFSQTRDMWYGNTEKNIKRIFTGYRLMAKQSERMPILLFNEADAILSVRQSILDHSHSTDKTENAIQNIILQEMESFDGILIATTNLTSNLDRAFERRFLYKVEFHHPTLQAKQQIWHAMLPDVDSDVLHRLAMHYDLTGGQIENVARKYMVQTILYGDSDNCYAQLSDFCHQETISGNESRKIGFG